MLIRGIRAKIKESVTLTIKIFKAYDKERNLEMGCADHRISSVCHPYRTWGNQLHRVLTPEDSKEILAHKGARIFYGNSYSHFRLRSYRNAQLCTIPKKKHKMLYVDSSR